MKIIVGLGNIGPKYQRNRHNVGFLALDELARQISREEGTELDGKNDTKLKAVTAKVSYKGEAVLLAKPTTLMNRSGEAVSAILSFYKEYPENLVVIYDDIDLPLGTIRFREKGSAGTHNGMRSIIEQLGTEEFPRLRIGIESRGEIAPAHQDLSSFVLSDFTPKEAEVISNAIQDSVTALKKLVLGENSLTT